MSRIAEAAFGDQPYPQTPGYKESGTSRDAAIKIRASADDLRSLVLHALSIRSMTADEVAAYVRRTPGAIRPRLSELRVSGRIMPTGERRKNESGMSAAVWRLK